MKKKIALLAIFTTFGISFATNGDNLIGVTPNSQAMGGIGVGMPVGATDEPFRNPAWLTHYDGFHVSFGGMIFMPTVKANNTVNFGPGMTLTSGEQTSNANLFLVPEVGITYKLNPKLTFGIGAYGVSGLGVDYNGKGNVNFFGSTQHLLADLRTNFQFLRIIPALAYQINPIVSIGAGIDLAYGALDLNAIFPSGCSQQGCTGIANYGGGFNSQVGVGAQVGVAFNFGNFVFAGINYQSPISLTYKHVFDFQGAAMGNPTYSYQNLKLEQPQELAIGAGIMPNDKWALGLDLRWIDWEDADGYKQFGWKNQYVLGLGTSYKITPKLTLRAGINYAKSPIRSNNWGTQPGPAVTSISGAPFDQYMVDYFNLVGFPAITELSAAVGASYQFTQHFGVSLAYEHAFNKSVTDSGLYCTPQGCAPSTITAKNAQDAVNVALKWNF